MREPRYRILLLFPLLKKLLLKLFARICNCFKLKFGELQYENMAIDELGFGELDYKIKIANPDLALPETKLKLKNLNIKIKLLQNS